PAPPGAGAVGRTAAGAPACGLLRCGGAEQRLEEAREAGTAGTPAGSCAAEHLGKVPELENELLEARRHPPSRRGASRMVGARLAGLPGLAEAVVLLALVGVLEDLVGLGDLLEAGLGVG